MSKFFLVYVWGGIWSFFSSRYDMVVSVNRVVISIAMSLYICVMVSERGIVFCQSYIHSPLDIFM